MEQVTDPYKQHIPFDFELLCALRDMIHPTVKESMDFWNVRRKAENYVNPLGLQPSGEPMSIADHFASEYEKRGKHIYQV